jgi:hypothetical protein
MLLDALGCTEALGITVSFNILRHASALEVLIGQFLKLCELNYWNGTVLNVAHGMIPVCLEFMHVLLQRPVRMDSIIWPSSCIKRFLSFASSSATRTRMRRFTKFIPKVA